MQSIQVKNQDFVRLDRFDDKNFTYRQQKILFFLTTLKLAYILEAILNPTSKESVELKEKRTKRKEMTFSFFFKKCLWH